MTLFPSETGSRAQPLSQEKGVAIMYVEEPIKLNREDFNLLMEDTDLHRICWMYHDILSDQQIALLFSRLTGKKEEREHRAVMAWVAPCQQKNSYYLLFKWYDNFYDPPKRIDLYLLNGEESGEEELVLYPVQMTFANRMTEKEENWYRNLWGKVSDNAEWFFGETDFEEDALSSVLRQLMTRRGQEMELFEKYYYRRSDGELCIQCRAIATYFRSIQAVVDLIHIALEDGGRKQSNSLDLKGVLEKMSAVTDLSRMGEYADSFSGMSEGFFHRPIYAPDLSREDGDELMALTEEGQIRWMHLKKWLSQGVWRELYFRCDPTGAGDVFQSWKGEVYFTVLDRSMGQKLHRGIYILTQFVDQNGQTVTMLLWMENTMGCVAHLCGGEFFDELLAEVQNGYVREADIPEIKDSLDIDRIYHQLKTAHYEAGGRIRR